jgi:alcohol oxidase
VVFDEWNLKGTGPLATNGIEAGVKIRPTEEKLKEMDSYLPRTSGVVGIATSGINLTNQSCTIRSLLGEFGSVDSYSSAPTDFHRWFGDHMLMPPGKFFTMFQ